MKTFKGKTGFKTCKVCNNSFEYELWNKTRTCCSIECASVIRMNGVKVTVDEFIHRARHVHKFRYDYSLITKLVNPIQIICNIHGTFTQHWGQHLKGSGCQTCAKENSRYTVADFIKKAKSVHGDLYDYSSTIYVNWKSRVNINCVKHGEFLQIPSQHISHKAGCPVCGEKLRISKGEKEWLSTCNIPDTPSNRQVYIIDKIGNKTYIIDGLSIDGTTIYEFLGDYWHGNPEIFKQTDYNNSCNKTYGELYSNTFLRFEKFKELGYNVEYIYGKMIGKINE